MRVQVCEGVWRQKCGRHVAVVSCEQREEGQRWTDGIIHYWDDGIVTVAQGGSVVELVEYIGPFPYSRPAETKSTTAVAGSVSDDPGRIIYDLDEKLKAANAETERLRIELQETYAGWSDSNSALADQAAEINKLKTQWQTEFTAAQQLRSEVAQLEQLLGEAREELQQLQADQAADEQHSEGMKAAFLATIKTLTGVRS